MADLLLYLMIAVFGLGLDTLLMLVCARLAGIEEAGVRASLLAALGASLPLAVASGVLMMTSTAGGLLLLAGAVVIGVIAVRAAYATTPGKALLTWFLHLCLWVLVSSLIIRRQL